MIVIVLSIIGAILGWRSATKREGDRMDKLQYGAAYFLAFAVAGIIITVIVDRFI
ncbi:apolipoprotein acyltransferase [Celeribacter marinus]|uniref:apolipoprotein acyltransferase n=1 Tax=Celeribacter marinus TaxID=1397108 RepID=UPI003F6C5803